MNTQVTNEPMLVQNPLNGMYMNLMPFFEYVSNVDSCKGISNSLEEAIDWMASTPVDNNYTCPGEKEQIAFRLIELKQLFRAIGELPTAKQGRS